MSRKYERMNKYEVETWVTAKRTYLVNATNVDEAEERVKAGMEDDFNESWPVKEEVISVKSVNG